MSLGRIEHPPCRICGEPVGPRRRTICADATCRRQDNAARQRAWYWNLPYGDGAPVTSKRREVVVCGICGKVIPHPVSCQRYCEGWCRKVASYNRMHNFYEAHKETVLTRQRAYKARVKEAARV